jgi:hypothetical protein
LGVVNKDFKKKSEMAFIFKCTLLSISVSLECESAGEQEVISGKLY